MVSGRYLSSAEREDIASWRAQDAGVREIARRLGRSPSTISRELRRNASTRTYRLDYKASTAQWHAERRARRPKTAKLVVNDRLRRYVQDRLAGVVRGADGRVAAGPTAEWKGRNKPHRGDRAWVTAWSPEQIANRLKYEFPEDDSMRLSHEAIYQALYVESRGGLERSLVGCLRGRALRVPRARARQKAWAHVTTETLIANRPEEIDERVVPGHWEGDLVIGLQRSAIGTLVERTTRFTMLIHLPREAGYGTIARTKNGPALAGYGAVTMTNALTRTLTPLPPQLRRSLTWDRGKELSDHARLTARTGVKVHFADPKSPWQRDTNENTNGLLRNTSRRAPTCPDGRHATSQPSRTPSTPAPAKLSAGRRPTSPSPNSYDRSGNPVLRRPIEYGSGPGIKSCAPCPTPSTSANSHSATSPSPTATPHSSTSTPTPKLPAFWPSGARIMLTAARMAPITP